MVDRVEDTTQMKSDYQFSKATIIGEGRIGLFLQKASSGQMVTRSSGTLCDTGPIIVCVRNKDLKGILHAIPHHRRRDLVLIQNGMIDPIIAEVIGSNHENISDIARVRLQESDTKQQPMEAERKSSDQVFSAKNRIMNVAADSIMTRGILYFAIEKKGDDPVDGGGTVFTGPHADFMVALLAKEGISAMKVDPNTFQIEMGKKLIWNSSFGLLGEIYQCSVADILKKHRQELESLILELAQVFEKSQAVSLGTNLISCLVSYAEKVGFYQTRVSEWEFRNGFFLSCETTPLHDLLAKKYHATLSAKSQ